MSAPVRWRGGVLVGLLVAGLYSIGAGRDFGIDASVTVNRFVVTDSLFDPFREQVVYNNHVLFSFLDHVVHSVTGSSDETVLRALPIAATAAAAAVLAAAIARRLGWPAAASAAVVIAANPVLIATGREVRGYSLLLLCAVVSTVLLFGLLPRPAPRRACVAAYVLVVAAGIATHLYGLAVLLVHPAIVGSDRVALRRWAPRWAAAGVLGLLPLAGVAREMASADRVRVFNTDFPLDLAESLLGGSIATAAVLAPLIIVGGAVVLRRPWMMRAGGVALATVFAAWIVAPRDLYPRFFIWLVPAIAYLVALAVARHRALAVLVVAFTLIQVVRFGPEFSQSDLASRSGADVAERIALSGGTACTFSLDAAAMEAYTVRFRIVEPGGDVSDCDAVIYITAPQPLSSVSLPVEQGATFPFRQVLDTGTGGLVFSRHPLP